MMNINFSPYSHPHNALVNDRGANPATEDGAVPVSRPISVPLFMDSLLSLGEEMVMQVGLTKDWITKDLKAELDLTLPGTNNENIDGKRDPLALKEKFGKIFYTGTNFMSYWQLHQAVNHLASYMSDSVMLPFQSCIFESHVFSFVSSVLSLGVRFNHGFGVGIITVDLYTQDLT
jgi:hypothetical protein